MTDSFRPIFKRTGDYCCKCYLDNLDKISKKKKYYKLIENSLIEIINSFEAKDKYILLAQTSIEKCQKCDYKNPYIFQILEKGGINFY